MEHLRTGFGPLEFGLDCHGHQQKKREKERAREGERERSDGHEKACARLASGELISREVRKFFALLLTRLRVRPARTQARAQAPPDHHFHLAPNGPRRSSKHR